MKVLIASGGTGGHFYPALAFYQQLKKSNHEVFFILKLNDSVAKLINEEKVPFQEICSAPFFGKSPLKILSAILRNLIGIIQSFRILRHFLPDCVVAFGSYVCVPPVLAAFCCRIPVFLHEQNLIPGWANRFCSIFAKKVAISFPETKKYFKDKAVLTGNLLRETFLPQVPQESRRILNLSPTKFTILIFGGSSGARRLNQWSLNEIEKFKELTDSMQFIHLSGNSEDSKLLRKRYADYKLQATVMDFTTKMEYCYWAADLAICRAGATTIAELILTQTPAFLVPYPHAIGNHQQKNAKYLEQMGAGIVIEETENFDQKLSSKLMDLLNNKEQLQKMKEAYLKFPAKLQEAASQFATVIEKELTQ